MKKRICQILAVLLIAATLGMVLPVHAEKMTDEDYEALFQQAVEPPMGFHKEMEAAFIADPWGFIRALADQDYNTAYLAIRNGLIVANWSYDVDCQAHREALVRIAMEGLLTQWERRVVSWMLYFTDIMTEYPVYYADAVDFTELFCKVLQAKDALVYTATAELVTAFDLDPVGFFKALAREEAATRDQILRRFHYYGSYDRDVMAETIEGVKTSGELDDAQLQLVEDFWNEVKEFIYGPGSVFPSTSIPTTTTVPPTTQAPTTSAPEPEPEKDPVKIPAVWVVIGVVAVIFGMQGVAMVRNKKRQEDEPEE